MRIIPVTAPAQQPPLWQRQLSEAITDPEELLRRLDLPLDLLPASLQACQQFRLRVPQGFLARMQPGDSADPLLRQVLPLGAELDIRPGYSSDPLNELASMPVPGVLHKYRNRVLLTTTGACAVHCRYCFRRHYPYNQANPTRIPAATLEYLRQQPQVNEVILSGGDPLTLTDTKLQKLVTELESLPQLERLRIHSRVPVVLPDRVDDALISWLEATRLQVILVIHANHANEIDSRVATAMQRLRNARVTLLNQAVLLRGINDRLAPLADLSNRLFTVGVLPYYLHQLDPVQGAAHFSVPDETAKYLLNQLSSELPGYLVPKLVREIAGQAAKTPV